MNATRPKWSSRRPAARRQHSCEICEALTRNSGRERTGAFCYAVGWTHHSFGVQIIRAASIIQGLLGNIGRPGGGIMALRGHCSIQGSTDIPTLFNMLPTYLPQPNAYLAAPDPAAFLKAETPRDRLVAQSAEIHDQPAEGLVWRARDGRTTSTATK